VKHVKSLQKKKMQPMDYGLFLLSRRDYAEAELRSKMVVHYRQHPELLNQCEQVIARLFELEYLDDERYAQSVARREAQRLRGPLKVKWTLERANITPLVIEQVLAEFNWRQICEDALQSKAHAYIDQSSKAFRFLASRGFSIEHIQASLDAVYA